jgi:hypothetical protein
VLLAILKQSRSDRARLEQLLHFLIDECGANPAVRVWHLHPTDDPQRSFPDLITALCTKYGYGDRFEDHAEDFVLWVLQTMGITKAAAAASAASAAPSKNNPIEKGKNDDMYKYRPEKETELDLIPESSHNRHVPLMYRQRYVTGPVTASEKYARLYQLPLQIETRIDKQHRVAQLQQCIEQGAQPCLPMPVRVRAHAAPITALQALSRVFDRV